MWATRAHHGIMIIGGDGGLSKAVIYILTAAGKCMWWALKRLREIKKSNKEVKRDVGGSRTVIFMCVASKFGLQQTDFSDTI